MNDISMDSFCESDYEPYDGIYAEYVETIVKSEKTDRVNEIVQEKKKEENNDDVAYEEYEKSYEEYRARYASYSNDGKTRFQVYFHKLGKKQILILSVLIIGVISLGIYFGLKDNSNRENEKSSSETPISEKISTKTAVHTTETAVHRTETAVDTTETTATTTTETIETIHDLQKMTTAIKEGWTDYQR